MGHGNPLLDDQGARFICILYFLAKGIRGVDFDCDKVYAELKVGGFSDQHLARAELIQFLEDRQPSPIEYNSGTNTVKLTHSGLQWAHRQCENRPYSDYRSLQYLFKRLFSY
jgi:hypothetical protein